MGLCRKSARDINKSPRELLTDVENVDINIFTKNACDQNKFLRSSLKKDISHFGFKTIYVLLILRYGTLQKSFWKLFRRHAS